MRKSERKESSSVVKVGDIIDASAFEKTHREFDAMEEFINAMKPMRIVWSWGASSWTRMNPSLLRFKVQGHHHKGHVYMAINHRDLFDIYLTSLRGKVKKTMLDVSLDEFIDVIDREVELVVDENGLPQSSPNIIFVL